LSSFNNLESFLLYRGRWALRLALAGLGIKGGAKVACQAFTCTAVPEAISALGASPIFIDIAPNSVNMCPKKLERALNNYNDIEVVIVQYTYGSDEHIDELMAICEKRGLPVIEDCCHLPFSPHTLSSLGDRSVAKFFSFEWGKPIALGVGGALVVTDDLLHKQVTQIFSILSRPPILVQLKIELQYIAYKVLYRPSTYHVLKKLFRFFARLGLGVGNHADVDVGINREEIKWKMGRAVEHRFRLSNFDDLDYRLRRRSENLRSYLKGEKINQLSSSSAYLMRVPIVVKDKTRAIKQAERENIELSDWYTTVVDPYSESQCAALGWDISECINAKRMADTIVTVSLIMNLPERYKEKLGRFLCKLE
jgi:hypothetical protein